MVRSTPYTAWELKNPPYSDMFKLSGQFVQGMLGSPSTVRRM